MTDEQANKLHLTNAIKHIANSFIGAVVVVAVLAIVAYVYVETRAMQHNVKHIESIINATCKQ